MPASDPANSLSAVKLPLWPILARAYAAVFREFPALLWIAWPWLAITALVTGCAEWAQFPWWKAYYTAAAAAHARSTLPRLSIPWHIHALSAIVIIVTCVSAEPLGYWRELLEQSFFTQTAILLHSSH